MAGKPLRRKNRKMFSPENMSPKGFWPDPRTDMFDQSKAINSPPWEVPRKRKNRGKKLYYFDLDNDELMKFYDGEVTTANKFEALVEEPIKDPMAHMNYFDLDNEDLMKVYDGEVTTASKFEAQVEEPIKDPMAHKNTNPTIRKICRRMIQEPQDDNPSNTHMLQKDSNKCDECYENAYNLKLYNNLLFNFINCKTINFCRGYSLDIINLDDPISNFKNNLNKKHDNVCTKYIVEDKGRYKVKYF